MLEHANREGLVDAIESLVSGKFPRKSRDRLVRGTDEQDLVFSGLEETMVTAFSEILDCRNRHRNITDLRTAAYVSAIKKVATSYLELGIFP